ncbi:hypothetical protein [Sutcliffiella sp. NC1]|uniref:hypothetical protein n=1 Tax=Sutcliffiella sp. NC1 TaxID=3004096 RepID=UPI0022DDE720|nr:hypothetical protein [Sutcliffiella sp. NC1]WBL16353.1 hypothetical protein O1A01_06895 [Sutcliffiella sp. NC1]
MGFLELLTIVFVVLKLMGIIAWSWFLVLLPAIIAVCIYVTWFIVSIVFVAKTQREVFKGFKDW